MQLPLQVPGAYIFFKLPSVLVNLLNEPYQGNSLPEPEPSPGGEGDGMNELQLILTSLKTW